MNEYKGIWTRRKLIQASAAAAVVTGVEPAWSATGAGVALVIDPKDVLAAEPENVWAANEVEAAFKARGVRTLRCESVEQAGKSDLCVVAGAPGHSVVQRVMSDAKMQLADQPEAIGVVHGTQNGRKVIAVTGSDVRGLMYALLEVADEARLSEDPTAALSSGKSVVERPANKVRSMTRLFTSDVEDKPWYNDREMWPQYLTMLAQQRFNRFNLAFGIGYDFIREVTDAYFLFTYPFLMMVAGYDVRATNLPDAERDANLAMLKFIAKQTVARGLEFHVGLWMHGYEWINSPNANHVIEGITKENHGPYCRDAVRMLLKEIPEISGLTFRIHGESGVTEGSYEFWKMVFEGVATCGRKVSLDMHTKGMDETMQNLALETGLPVQMSPKYWGEHLGLPYHQSDIRVMEQPKAGAENATGLMKLSAGTRSFLRYGYGDLLREDRKWAVVHRIWPGTQRLLLWGDPQAAAAYSRAFSFCGSEGVELMEMLSFKGRRGSGIAGNRTAYADKSLAPRWDWQKYEYTNRVWGRMLYNPETSPEVFLRGLRADFGAASGNVSAALAQASRILPSVFTVYGASAANNLYWPEMYTNEGLIDKATQAEYSDSPKPVFFHTASTFDPPMFSRMVEFAEELLGKADPSGRYSPVEVAQWIEDYAAEADRQWKMAETKINTKQRAGYRRAAVDINMQVLLGRFFAKRLRSGVLYAIYEQTSDARALTQSLELYKQARVAWAALADLSKGVYLPDITVGETPCLRGHWSDRLLSIDSDIALVEAKLKEAKPGTDIKVAGAIASAAGTMTRKQVNTKHAPPATFATGKTVPVTVTAPGAKSVMLHYRHVNQAERYTSVAMKIAGEQFTAEIPSSYTKTEYPLQYFFQITGAAGEATISPGLGDARMSQPYYVVRRA